MVTWRYRVDKIIIVIPWRSLIEGDEGLHRAYYGEIQLIHCLVNLVISSMAITSCTDYFLISIVFN